MRKARNALLDFLKYKPPRNEEGFELLESRSESLSSRGTAAARRSNARGSVGRPGDSSQGATQGQGGAQEQSETQQRGAQEQSGTQQGGTQAQNVTQEEGRAQAQLQNSEAAQSQASSGRRSRSRSSGSRHSRHPGDSQGHRSDSDAGNEREHPDSSSPGQDKTGSDVSSSVDQNIDRLKQEFKIPFNEDVLVRHFRIWGNSYAALAFIQGMADKIVINTSILRPIMESNRLDEIDKSCAMDFILDNVLSIANVRRTNDISTVVTEMLDGFAALFIDGCCECLLLECKGFERRAIDKPSTETTIKGAQEAFIEDLRTNITLIRRIVRNKNLMTETIPVASTNNFTCAVMFIDGIANPKLVQEVKRRINAINTDILTSDGMLEQFIEDRPFTIFPQVLSTERPDRAASFLLEGQVVVVSEGSPFVFAVPVTLYHLYHTSEDANQRWQFATALRFVRILGIVSSALLPGLYLALTLYHREMIPTELLVSIARAKESIPFPGLIEVLLMEISFEVIREAGTRVPGVIGPTLGIIGALILGQAAVSANLVSPVLIIIVAVTGLGNFAIPNYAFATSIRILRFLFVIIGCIAGFYGIAACTTVVFANMCSLKSFGVPYLTPVAPVTRSTADLVVRAPIWKQETRPDYLNELDGRRQPKGSRSWDRGDPGTGNKASAQDTSTENRDD